MKRKLLGAPTAPVFLRSRKGEQLPFPLLRSSCRALCPLGRPGCAEALLRSRACWIGAGASACPAPSAGLKAGAPPGTLRGEDEWGRRTPSLALCPVLRGARSLGVCKAGPTKVGGRGALSVLPVHKHPQPPAKRGRGETGRKKGRQRGAGRVERHRGRGGVRGSAKTRAKLPASVAAPYGDGSPGLPGSSL